MTAWAPKSAWSRSRLYYGPAGPSILEYHEPRAASLRRACPARISGRGRFRTMPEMTGSRYFAEAMQAAGVSHIFFVPTMLLPALAEIEDMGIRRVMTHGEKAAAYIADGYARASRKPGICMVQNVGAANLAAGLRDPYLAGSPVIALTGGPAPSSHYRHLYQEIDDLSMFDPVTKANMRLDTLDRLPDVLRQAFRAATSGSPGPVHIEMRGSHGQVLEAEADLDLLVEQQFCRAPAFR